MEEAAGSQRALFDLLTSLFSADELRRVVRFLPDGDVLSNALPGQGVSFASLCEALIDELRRRGMLNATFFDRLREERPRRVKDIDDVATVWGDSASNWEPPIADDTLEPGTPGETRTPLRSVKLRFTVEASDDERALGVDDYATALATVLDRSDGGVFFAVFGAWGRGKTFLMRRLTKLLPELRWLSRSYKVVWFSAWKYPTTPEVWVHLYETLAARAYSGRWAVVTRRVIRSNLRRRGITPALVTVMVGAAAMLPITFYAHVVWYLLAIFGLFGLLSLVRVGRAVVNPARRLKHLYANRVSHAEKLGLQAVIGDDLRALIDGWVRGPTNSSLAKGQLVVSLGVIFVVTAALSTGLASLGTEHGGLRALITESGHFLASAAALWLAWPPRSVDRVLLVVDDLDRCKPDHLCDVIESLKLMAEAPELAGRIQVAALLEEEALDWAIAQRFRARSESSGEGGRRSKWNGRDRLVREHKEKLFLGHLRLPELSAGEVGSLLRNYLYEGKGLDRPTAMLPADAAAGAVVLPVVVLAPPSGGSGLAVPARSSRDIARRSHEGELFEVHEREALMMLAPLLVRAQVGPRSLRSFLFRYQLARLLLAMRGADSISPDSLARGLLVPGSNTTVDEQLLAVLDMVR